MSMVREMKIEKKREQKVILSNNFYVCWIAGGGWSLYDWIFLKSNHVRSLLETSHFECAKLLMKNMALSFQGIIWPQVITGLIVNLLNALVNYIVLFVLKMGVAWVSHTFIIVFYTNA